MVDGGQGGSDPTPGGPGGGFPADCAKGDAQRASIGGPGIPRQGEAAQRRAALTIPVTLNRGPVCDVEIALVGPHGRVFATGRTLRLKGGPRRVRLERLDRLPRGGYRLHVTALSRLGDHVLVRSAVRVKLT